MSGAVPASGCRARTLASRRRAVERAIRTMQERLGEPLSLAVIAGAAASSPYHFDRIFRQVTGLPPFRFLAALRLEEAKRLLLTTGYTATSICFEVGYNSVGSFTRHFSESVGIPPSRLRRLASRPVPTALAGGAEAPEPRRPPRDPAGVAGRVEAPDGFAGVVMLGLFPDPLPRGRPSACVLLRDPGPFRTGPVPDGTYHLFAAGVTPTADGRVDPLEEDVLRGSAGPVEVRGGEVSGDTVVVLRPRELIDPPILVSLPLLLVERR